MIGWAFDGMDSALKAIFNGIGTAIWSFVNPVVVWIFSFLDRSSVPNLHPDQVLGANTYGMLIWTGGFFAILFALIQIATLVIHRGRGLGDTITRIAGFAMAYGMGLALMSSLLIFANALSSAIVKSSFSDQGWAGLCTADSFMGAQVKGIAGLGLAILSLFFILPFGFVMLVEVLVREGGIEVLAATYPIVLASLIHERLQEWFWKALRWMCALIFMLPALALAIAVGHGLVTLASKPENGQAAAPAIANAFVGVAAGTLGLMMPMVLFKLFAFVDPSTVSGGAAHSALRGMRDKLSGDKADGDVGSDAVGADGSDEAGNSARTDSTSSGGGGGSSAGSTAAALFMGGVPGLDAGGIGGAAASSLDSYGAGHAGGPQGAPDDEPSQDGSSSRGPNSSPEDLDPPTPIPDTPIPEDPVAGVGGGPAAGGPAAGGGAGGGGAAAGGAAGGEAAAAVVVL